MPNSGAANRFRENKGLPQGQTDIFYQIGSLPKKMTFGV